MVLPFLCFFWLLLSLVDYLIQYFATDIAGNMSQISPGLPIIIKGQSIQQPEINSIEGPTETGTWGSSYNSTFTDGWISVSGTSEPFHRIEIFDSSKLYSTIKTIIFVVPISIAEIISLLVSFIIIYFSL